MFRSFTAWLGLLSVAAALPADFASFESPTDIALEKRGDGYNPVGMTGSIATRNQ